MSSNMVILILLGSFFSDGSASFSHCLCSSSFCSILPTFPRQIFHHYLPADGKGNQLLQPDGSTVLYYHGSINGLRRYFGKAYCFS